MTIVYDAGDLGTLRTVLKLRHTMVILVAKSPAFWILILTHIALLTVDRHDRIQYTIPFMDWNAAKAFAQLLTFFLVFYVGNAYSRLNMFYGHCVGLSGSTMDWVGLVHNYVPPNRDVQWNCIRCILASMHIIYYSLNESSDGAPAISDEEWGLLRSRNLLNLKEIEMLKAYKGNKPFLPLNWAMMEFENAINAGEIHEHDLSQCQRFRILDLLAQSRELLYHFRGHCGQITNWLKQPVPFQYYHALSLSLVGQLLIYSWGLISLEMHSALTAWVYITLCVGFFGLKEVRRPRAAAATAPVTAAAAVVIT